MRRQWQASAACVRAGVWRAPTAAHGARPSHAGRRQVSAALGLAILGHGSASHRQSNRRCLAWPILRLAPRTRQPDAQPMQDLAEGAMR